MLKLKLENDLIVIAFDLIRIAVCSLPMAILFAPRGWRTSEASLERARECFSGTEPDGNRSSENWKMGLRRESHRRYFNSTAAQIVTKGFAHPRGEESVEMERRKMGDLRQCREIERFVELAVYVIEHLVHAPLVHRTTVSRLHSAPDDATSPTLSAQPRANRLGFVGPHQGCVTSR